MIQLPRRRRPRLSRSLYTTSAAALGIALGSVGVAHAAGLNESLDWSTFPADFAWDGSVPQPTAAFPTGAWDASVYQSVIPPGQAPLCGPLTQYGDAPSCVQQHLRGGVLLPDLTPDGSPLPIAVLPGDVLQALNAAGAVVQSGVVTAPQPVISSVIGQPNFTIAKTADTTSFEATLYRRVPRIVTHDTGVTPGVDDWYQDESPDPDYSPPRVCTWLNYATQTRIAVANAVPAKPTAPADAGYTWVLGVDKPCSTTTTTVQGAPYESISSAQLLAVTPTSYTASFGPSLAAGDLIEYSATTGSNVSDVDKSVSISNTVPVGTIPPADVTAPKIQTFDFGAAATTVRSFTKHGFLTFISLDEPSHVTEQLTVLPPKTKKKPKTAKQKLAAKTPVVIGVGAAATTAAGQTARVNVVVTPAGKKLLKKLKGKPAKATLVTTIVDAVGNAVTTSTPYKLAGK